MISRAQIGQILKVYKTQGTVTPQKADGVLGSSSVKDGVDLSFSSADLEKVKELVKDLPDIRLDKIEAIAKEIEAGTYKVDSTQVADKILGRLLADRLK